MQGNWIEEHGDDYEVPALIVGALVDCSWKNDTCPCFGKREDGGEADVLLWIEHPDHNRREYWGAARFTVVAAGAVAFEGDEESDAAEALAVATARM